jgi:hypothetical protein
VKPLFEQASVEEQEYLAAANITALITSWAVYLGAQRVRVLVHDVDWAQVDQTAVHIRGVLGSLEKKPTPAAN